MGVINKEVHSLSERVESERVKTEAAGGAFDSEEFLDKINDDKNAAFSKGKNSSVKHVKC